MKEKEVDHIIDRLNTDGENSKIEILNYFKNKKRRGEFGLEHKVRYMTPAEKEEFKELINTSIENDKPNKDQVQAVLVDNEFEL